MSLSETAGGGGRRSPAGGGAMARGPAAVEEARLPLAEADMEMAVRDARDTAFEVVNAAHSA